MTLKPPDHDDRGARAGLIYGDLTRAIISAFFEVYNTLGFGFLEAVYARALFLELTDRGFRVEREVMIDVYYKGRRVGRYRADLLVESRVVIEVKATRCLVKADRDQLMNYVRGSGVEVGLLLHFGPRPSCQRVIAENARSKDPAISRTPRLP